MALQDTAHATESNPRDSLPRAMSADPLNALRRLVVDDPSLRQRLLAVTDRDAFTLEVIDVATEAGIEITPDQVSDGLREARRRRLERWL